MSLNQIVVKGVINTTAGNGQGQGINLDAIGNLPLTKVKRYSLSIHLANLFTAPAGIDKVVVNVGVLDGNSSFDITVGSFDPATVHNNGILLPPYVGTNSFITIVRGADGKGNVPIRLNAIVEAEQ
jgi:hypothetical protein